MSSIATCASRWYSPTETSCVSGKIPTSRVRLSGAAVTIGRSRYTAAESAETSSPSTRSATASATAVLPDAVGPKIARTLALRARAGGLLEAMLELVRVGLLEERAVLLRVRLAPLAEPRYAFRNARVERRRGRPVEEVARLANVRHVARHLAEQRRREPDLRLRSHLGADQLGGAHERVPLAVGEVDRRVGDAPVGERVDPSRDPVDTVVDVCEVEHLLVAAVYGDRLPARDPVDEEREHARHPLEIVVEPAVDVREPEDEVAEPVAPRVRVDERLARDLRRRVRRLRVREVSRRFPIFLEPVDVAVHLARRREDERQVQAPRVLEDVERHDRVLERAVRLPDELVHLRVRGEVDDEVDDGVLDAADPARERRVMPGKVLQQVRKLIRPRVLSLVDAEDGVAVRLKTEREVGAD